MLRIAERVPSAALRSDGHLSAIGATQAGVVLVGSLLTAQWSVTWADNAAALVVGVVAIVLAISTWREIPSAS
jgi:divalent metal cation (Fe/Co/Zn/Cd) transporter